VGMPPLASRSRSGSAVFNGTAVRGGEQLPMPQVRRPPSSGTPQQLNAVFHKGLVNALHGVLKKQRAGVFPEPSCPSQPLPSSPIEPRPSSILHNRDTVEEIIRQKKVEWVQRRWESAQRQQRKMRERNLSASDASPFPDIMLGDDLADDTDVALSELLRSAAQEEASKRQQLATQAEQQLASMFANFRGLVVSAAVRGEHAVSSPTSATSRTGVSFDLRGEGNLLYEQGQFSQAHHVYSMAILADPSNPTLLTNRAAASMMLLNYDACANDCLLALSIDGKNAKAAARLAKSYALMHQYRNATRYYRMSIELSGAPAPYAGKVHDELISVPVLEKMMRFAESDAFDQVIATYATLKAFQTEPPVALARFRALVHVDPVVARSELTKHVGAIEPPQSGTSMDLVLKANISTHYCDLLMTLARATFFCGQHFLNLAVSHAKQCLQHKPEFRPATAFVKMITALDQRITEAQHQIQSGRYSDAQQSITAALAIEPTNRKLRSSLYLQRAEVASSLGNTAASIADCGSAIESDGANVKAYTRRAKWYATLGDYTRAIKDMERAVELNPSLSDELAMLIHSRDADADAFQSFQRKFQLGDRPPSSSSLPTQLYAALDIGRHATQEQIKAQYRRLILQHHPDKLVGQSDAVRNTSEQKFKDVSQAYHVLSDPSQRALYDKGLLSL